ncbi:FAD-binding protein [Streptomyces sp. NPDC054884]|uniref:FAD-binding protein n=1 Tax=Streptomyces sp. ME08-AFT2 TaxID=3028683 RepID=UPI0029A9D487|nr:FAD-binding protein [Streptomyces sp. ME08-AFT2]MDX3311198.1 FAD-binding protein [Streptomyces sp. ME08-AFT2]
MPRIPSRRTVLRGLTVTGAAVAAFDTASRSWAATAAESETAAGSTSSASTTSTSSTLAKVPRLDGTLLTDASSLTAAADDYGHIVHNRPAAVLRPGSVRDVVTMIRFCNDHQLPVAPRGQGHSPFGQAQAPDGLVIETTPLAGIGSVNTASRTVTVGAGAKWSAVARATLAHGLTPPVFTDYLELSVGGTLSVGGLGGQAHRVGAQVDNVTELQVVTGAGELVRCSPSRRPDLFRAVLAGLGQCAVIVEATLRLVPAPTTVRRYQLTYSDLTTFLDDQRTLVREGRFDYVEGQVQADATGAFGVHVLEAVAYGPPVGPAPDDTALLRGLRHDPATVHIVDQPYYDFLDRLAPVIAAMKAAGIWGFAHPWLNLMLPGASAAALASQVLDGLTPADAGPGAVILFYPLLRERLTTPLLRTSDDDVSYLFDILSAAAPDDTAAVDRLLAVNRSAYDTVAAAGGTHYPVGSIPLTPADWQEHFGPAWAGLQSAKCTYDPRGILAPGQGIFG